LSWVRAETSDSYDRSMTTIVLVAALRVLIMGFGIAMMDGSARTALLSAVPVDSSWPDGAGVSRPGAALPERAFHDARQVSA